MSAQEDLSIALLPDQYYHLFNRGINRGKIFFKEENYSYFLEKYFLKTEKWIETLAYCLLENHFHLLIKVKCTETILNSALDLDKEFTSSFTKDYILPWLWKIRETGLMKEIERMSIYGEAEQAAKQAAEQAAEQAEQDLTNFKNLSNLVQQDLVQQDLVQQDLVQQDLVQQELVQLVQLVQQLPHTYTNPLPKIQIKTIVKFYQLVKNTKGYQDFFSSHEILAVENLHKHEFGIQVASYIVSEKLRGFLLGYSKAINIQEKRTGSLFQKAFRRKCIEQNQMDLRFVLSYIHHNPIHHNYCTEYQDYKWSSYRKYTECNSQFIKIVHDWFDGLTSFIDFHRIYKLRKSDVDWFES